MAASDFQVVILEQGWLDGGAAEDDLCSHGRIRLVIGGQLVATGESGPNEYGISESALALLRTLECDHSPEHPIAERLIFHGCGTILMMGCPIGIDWTVKHERGRVHISNVVRYDTTNAKDGIRFDELRVDLPLTDYRRELVTFARKAKEPFGGIQKRFYSEWEPSMYEEFWREYDLLLARHDSII